MEKQFVEVSTRGKVVQVPALAIADRKVIVNGGWLKIAEIHDEPWQLDAVADPAGMAAEIHRQAPGADIFTFSQRPPDNAPRFPYPHVLDNIAAANCTNYDAWWEGLPQETRKNVRRSAKRGVTVNTVPFDDALVQGIKGLYDESPIRQGRRFWHYGKDLAAIRQENSSYLNRAEFIGAWFEGELIGFLKLVYLGNAGRIMQILSKNSHYDKRPMNALIAKAMEVCAAKGMTYFIYGQYIYGNNTDAPIIEFKRRNGFEPVTFPKYYVPLTAKGSMAIKLNLHLGVRRLLPRKVENALLAMRSKFLQKNAAKPAAGAAAETEAAGA